MFRCVAYVRTLMQTIINDKITPRNRKIRLMRYKLINIYCLFNSVIRLITLLKNVIFNKKNFKIMKKKTVRFFINKKVSAVLKVLKKIAKNKMLLNIIKKALNLVKFKKKKKSADCSFYLMF